jgi:hypothetical protein
MEWCFQAWKKLPTEAAKLDRGTATEETLVKLCALYALQLLMLPAAIIFTHEHD